MWWLARKVNLYFQKMENNYNYRAETQFLLQREWLIGKKSQIKRCCGRGHDQFMLLVANTACPSSVQK